MQPESLELYRWAVQDPETHAELFRIMYICTHPGRSPRLLREDFAGTAADSVAWVAMREGRQAIAVERDAGTAGWARRRADRILGSRAGDVEIIVGDVHEAGPPSVPAADIISVLNYSIFYLHDAEALNSYLSHARTCLAPGGLMVMNMLGGPGATRTLTRKRRVAPCPKRGSETAIPPFDYIWEQRSYDPNTGVVDCRIHFEMAAGREGAREIRDAFQYDFRIWSAQELMVALLQAGFDDVEVWRHTWEPEKGQDGLFLGPVPLAELEPLDYWTAYVLATRED